MKRRFKILILGLPFLLAVFLTLIILWPSPQSSTTNTLPFPSVPVARGVPTPLPPVNVLLPVTPVPHEISPSEGELPPVVMFVRGAPYEKIRSLIDQHREDEAIVVLQEFVRTTPGDPEAYLLLARLYYQKDQLEEALFAWNKVLEVDPNNATAKANIERATREREAQSGFTRAMTRHFTIKFEGAENRALYQTVLGILEDAYGTVGRALQFYPDEEVIVLLYTEKQFFDVTRVPAWTGGVYDGKIRIPTKGFEEKKDQMKQILVHEYVHAVVHQMTHKGPLAEATLVPTWFNEGIAQYLSTPDGSTSAHNRVRGWIRRGAFIKLSELHGSFMGFDHILAAVAYDESYSAVAYLVDHFGLWRLKRILEELAHPHSGNMEEAVRSALLLSYDQFQSRWEEELQER